MRPICFGRTFQNVSANWSFLRRSVPLIVFYLSNYSPFSGEMGVRTIWKRERSHPVITPLFCVFIVLGLFRCSVMTAEAQEQPTPLPYHVGYRILDFPFQKDGQEKTLTVAVWYPTAAEPGSHNYGGPTNGQVAVDAAPLTEKGPFPLLVFFARVWGRRNRRGLPD